MAGMIATEVQLSPKASSRNPFSKIARSPTSSKYKTSKAKENNPEANTFAERATGILTQGAFHSTRPVSRPGFSRQISAPVTVAQVPRYDLPELDKHHSDLTGNTAMQASAMLDRHQTSALSPQDSLSPPIREPSKAVMGNAPLSSGLPSIHQAQPINLYQQLHELSTKRMATLEYLRKMHEGHQHFLNTYQLSKNEISRLPNYTPNKLSKRATNFFLLGLSLPNVLDVHKTPAQGTASSAVSDVALQYLRGLNNLLAEFETYQSHHPTDGSSANSLSRGRVASIFKRSGTTSRPRKSSDAVGFNNQISPPAVPGTPYHHLSHQSHASVDTTSTSLSSAPTLTNHDTSTSPPPPIPGGPNIPLQRTDTQLQQNPAGQDFAVTATFPPAGDATAQNSSVLSNEQAYSYLLTPPLPFAPDFQAVFATLCDVLIETYLRLLKILEAGGANNCCNGTIVEAFGKADAKIRKIMVLGTLKDFENVSREGAKKELGGVTRIVLGGLIG